ncbi:hypothetical protein BGZ61DRAFT_452169 [Ilyonectria robusta]|uniref:uncharacterized protein n=1 Tax=Ilyonectria robusta TaxID=1079257 RepID=UPI001E8D4BAC|nr:uncharacterized protein BGZ61DRAFT_452169 [Ilyonectria robusta]KAH8694605.1 hypothetical protein BGZ61DRAFT_452169 [Ilyonectria robusta]
MSQHTRDNHLNRRLFAMADNGYHDGTKCDMDGNVFSGCGDGVYVWSPGGVLIGNVLIPGRAANLFFVKRGELFILNSKSYGGPYSRLDARCSFKDVMDKKIWPKRELWAQ